MCVGAHYWVVGLVNSQDEDELGEEECGPSVVDYAGLVALHGPQAEEEDDGKEEEAQRHTDRAPRQEFNRQNLPVLTRTTREGKTRRTVCGVTANVCVRRLSPPSWRHP